MRHFVLPATRKRDAEAWAALVSGAADLAATPIPDDPAAAEPLDLRRYGCAHPPTEECRRCGGYDHQDD